MRTHTNKYPLFVATLPIAKTITYSHIRS